MIRIVVIDSGVHAAHPHVQGVAGGVGVAADGALHDDYLDRLGHGTAVAAVIREKVPDAELLAARIFDRELAATGAALVAALRWAVARQPALINLSLGTTNAAHRDALAEVVHAAVEARVAIVAAAPTAESPWLPGALPRVVAVHLDWSIPRDRMEVAHQGPGRLDLRASGFPRPAPNVDPERNLKGVSFAVANATGLLAIALRQNRALLDKTVFSSSNY
ncbi:MAG: S8 family serine peptidase [Acidobacteriota bacterium]